MTRRALLGLFAAVLIVALIALIPLRVAIAALSLDERGFAAREATGLIWSGGFTDARLGAVALGNLRAAADPFPLLLGRANIAMGGPLGDGWVTVTRGSLGVGRMTAQLATGAQFAPLPLSAIALEDATIRFERGRCAEAQGRVRAIFSGDVAGLSLARGMSGTPRCEGGRLVLPLISQSAMERITLRIAADGAYSGEFVVKPGDPAVAARLVSAGFQVAQGGHVMRLSGTL
ncbi:MAG: type II secretion system protein N [Sphingomonadaceae bacterium]